MPSVADVIFVGLLAAIVFSPLSVKLLGDAGIGWHIRTGQLILATHAIPHVDPFSSSMAGKPWFAWEWLYDVIVGQLEGSLGLNGVVWLTAIVIAATFAAMFRMLVQRGVDLVVAVSMVLLALSASTIHFLARPHVVSWLFTLIWYWILDAYERNGWARNDWAGTEGTSRRLWMLPPLMLAWVNMHGGFLVGFVLLGIFWVSAIWTWFFAREGTIERTLDRIAAIRRSRQLLGVGLLSAAASFANPYGWKLHAHIYSYLTDRFLMDHIGEFQSPDFHGLAQKCFAVLLLVVLLTLANHRHELRVSQILIVLFAVYSGLYASRNIPVSSILLGMVAAPLISADVSARGFLARTRRTELSLRGHLWPIAAIIVTFAIASAGGHVGEHSLMDAHFDPGRMPVRAVDYLQQRDLQQRDMGGPILSPDSWGGYLIYRLHPSGIYPERRVVVDDRHDFYGDAFFKSYLKMIHVETGWQGFLREHEVSCLLLPRDSALANVIAETHEWKPIYSDETAIAFVPAGARGEPELPSR